MVSTLRLAAWAVLLGLPGLAFFTSGCSKNRAANAQSPPPPSLSAPVRAERPTPAPQAISSVALLPVEERADGLEPPGKPSKPLPVVVVPPPKETAVTAPPPVESPAAAAPAPEKPSYHTMQKGDTLYGVARKYNLKLKDLLAANQFKDPNRIAVGTKVKLP